MSMSQKIKIVFVVILLFAFGGVLYAWNNQRLAKVSLPCEEPIAYTVGVFDRRFGISYKYFLSALSEAEAIWEKPIGKELFVYSPAKSVLLVNLIYDSRQETTKTLSSIGNTLEENKSAYKELQNKYAALKREYDSTKNEYEMRANAFDEQNRAYQMQVETWNRGKRTSRVQFDQLEQARLALEAKVSELRTLESNLNGLAKEINTLVDVLNRLAISLNLSVKKYNTIGASRGETFTGGVYSLAEGDQNIDVYEFSSREKLVRILAHELGHALGLGHVEDPEAIMYRLNEGDKGALATSDLAALKALCYNKDIIN